MAKPLNIIFAGTPEFALPCLQALIDSPHQLLAVYTQPDRPAGRGRQLRPSPVKTLALQHSLPVEQPVSLRSDEAQAKIAALNADLMIVVAYGLILPEAVLNLPCLGCINVHASLLPRWRGAAPIQRAILAGDTETGVTIMQMAAGLDTGAMFNRLSCAITADETAASLHDKLADLGAKALANTLEALQARTAQATPQDEALACYAAKLDKQEAHVDWQQEAEYLARTVRAFNPWPVAYCHFNGQNLRLWQAEVVADMQTAKPGTILQVDRAGILVATGKGALRLLTIQLPGGKALKFSEILNAKPELFLPGMLLG